MTHRWLAATKRLWLCAHRISIENEPFAGHPVLALTTHCRTGSSQYEQYLLKEYLAYRLYGLFTDKSLRARLARITYRTAVAADARTRYSVRCGRSSLRSAS